MALAFVASLVACASRRDARAPAGEAVETTGAEIPSGSGGPAEAWTTPGGPASPGVPSMGSIVVPDASAP